MQSNLNVNDVAMQPLVQVTGRHGLVSLSSRLSDLRNWLGEDLQTLEAALTAVEASCQAADGKQALSGAPHDGDTALRPLPGTRVRGAAAHLLGRTGKRIRPLCVLLAARLGGHAA